MFSDDIKISDLTEDDIEEVRAIGMSTPELHIESGSTDYYAVETLRRFIKSPHDIYLSAKTGSDLAGYLLATFNPYLKEAYIIDLVVKPEYRNRGVATLLIDKCVNRLKEKECSWMWLLVQEGNERMYAFSKKKGFIKGRKFTFYYKVA